MNTLEEKNKTLLENNPFARHIGIELLESREGFALGRIALTKEVMNIYGGMHGGCSYALADTLAGLAAASYGYYVTTINGSMNYLLPVGNTKYAYCEASVVRQGSSIGVYDVLIKNDAGDILCTGTFNYYRLNKKIPEETR